jgi:hypothetical protein
MKELSQAVTSLLKPAAYHAIRQRIQALSNRAVFEVPDVLENILSHAESLRRQQTLIG